MENDCVTIDDYVVFGSEVMLYTDTQAPWVPEEYNKKLQKSRGHMIFATFACMSVDVSVVRQFLRTAATICGHPHLPSRQRSGPLLAFTGSKSGRACILPASCENFLKLQGRLVRLRLPSQALELV